MKRYAIRYDANGEYERSCDDSPFKSLHDDDGRFGTDDINEAYYYLHWLTKKHGDIYTIVDKVIR